MSFSTSKYLSDNNEKKIYKVSPKNPNLSELPWAIKCENICLRKGWNKCENKKTWNYVSRLYGQWHFVVRRMPAPKVQPITKQKT